MKSLALKPQSNTFIRENNRLTFTKTNLDYLTLKVHSVISIFLGEFFIDQTLGIPYIPNDDNKGAHRTLIESALKTKITAVEGINKITYFYSTLNKKDRQLLVDFIAETEAGEELEIRQLFTIPTGPGGNG